jgi:hypothetical protein
MRRECRPRDATDYSAIAQDRRFHRRGTDIDRKNKHG